MQQHLSTRSTAAAAVANYHRPTSKRRYDHGVSARLVIAFGMLRSDFRWIKIVNVPREKGFCEDLKKRYDFAFRLLRSVPTVLVVLSSWFLDHANLRQSAQSRLLRESLPNVFVCFVFAVLLRSVFC